MVLLVNIRTICLFMIIEFNIIYINISAYLFVQNIHIFKNN